MLNDLTVIGWLTRYIGPELCQACQQNDLAMVKDLTSTTNTQYMVWVFATLIAAFERATDVASYCIEQQCQPGCLCRCKPTTVKDRIISLVYSFNSLVSAYCFLVESNLIDPDHHGHEEWGTLLSTETIPHGREPRLWLIEYLLQKGADPNQVCAKYGHNDLLLAVAAYGEPEGLRLLLDYGATLEGSGALVHAAARDKAENIKYLLDRGADVDEMNDPKYGPWDLKNAATALHIAVERGCVDVIDVLVNAGANVTLRNAKGKTAVEIARELRMDAATITKLS